MGIQKNRGRLPAVKFNQYYRYTAFEFDVLVVLVNDVALEAASLLRCRKVQRQANFALDVGSKEMPYECPFHQ